MNPWNERRLSTEEQIVTIEPNEERTSIVLRINEMNCDSPECRLYLTYEEAQFLSKQILGFIEDNINI